MENQKWHNENRKREDESRTGRDLVPTQKGEAMTNYALITTDPIPEDYYYLAQLTPLPEVTELPAPLGWACWDAAVKQWDIRRRYELEILA